MKKIVFRIAITLAILLSLSGCSESVEDKAKAEFREKIFSIKIIKNDFKQQAKTITEEYEKKYGMKANVWLEELKETNEWNAMVQKSYDTTVGKKIDYTNFNWSLDNKKGDK